MQGCAQLHFVSDFHLYLSQSLTIQQHPSKPLLFSQTAGSIQRHKLCQLRSSKMSQFLDVDAAYDDAPLPYIAFEDDDAATLVGTDAGASDIAAVDDAATLVGPDTGTSAEDGTGVVDHVAALDTRSHASTDDDRSVTAVHDFDVRGGDVLYPAADDFDVRGGDVLYPAADDFDARELYEAADEIHRRIESRPAAGLRAGTAAPIGPAPAGRLARVRRVLRSVGRRLRRFFPK
ncbi:hypothetical protein B0H15DRAFT_802519 [Mycena belliarum]|uniref:Uncharacterized protein n=1 Tax=Mycena belliarum TaxID=1033014 RepID=A0AAD6XP01_9AGAR|nr:hypothetical protein B0H15DRAFT_802519 [Mycena belliae]